MIVHKILLFLALAECSANGLAQDTIVPGNLFSAQLSSVAARNGSDFVYSYDLVNNIGSQQGIWQFWLITRGPIQVSQQTLPTGWSRGIVPDGENTIISWGSPDSADILPGSSNSGFGFMSGLSIPGLIEFYTEGDHPLPTFEEGMAHDEIPGYSDLTPYGPGKLGLTVGPVPLPSNEPFASVAFTDTLISYTTRSRALSWILSQPTSDKYVGIFTRVKSDLQQNDKASAQSRLDTVLQQVPIDSAGSLLTSEAYALLRFNTEHLKTMIPLDPLPVQLYYFTAAVQPDLSVRLEWGTVTETNNYGFFVQRRNVGLMQVWTELPNSFVAGHGTTTIPHEYSFVDNSTSAGTWQYRLKQVDIDGTQHYIDPVTVIIAPPQSGVQWAYFNASLQLDGTVLVEWGTLTETNNEGFEVQKSTDPQEGYETLISEPGQGTTTDPHDYSYVDRKTDYGTWYYRIKQTSTDGSIIFTNPVEVKIKYTVVQEEGLAATITAAQKLSIDWTTVREEKNSHFEIQVSRNDSLHHWTLPGSSIKGAGNSTSRRHYKYSQRIQASGTWYFRLKQTSTDGGVRYSRSVRAWPR